MLITRSQSSDQTYAPCNFKIALTADSTIIPSKVEVKSDFTTNTPNPTFVADNGVVTDKYYLVENNTGNYYMPLKGTVPGFTTLPVDASFNVMWSHLDNTDMGKWLVQTFTITATE